MLRDGRTRCGPETIDHINHARRESRLLGQRGHVQGSQRCLFGRLHHNGAANGQRRTPFPGQHQQRIVPRYDLTNHTDWLFACHRNEAASGNGVAKELVRPAGIVLQRHDRDGYIEECLSERFAIVLRLDAGQQLLVAFHQLAESTTNESWIMCL